MPIGVKNGRCPIDHQFYTDPNSENCIKTVLELTLDKKLLAYGPLK